MKIQNFVQNRITIYILVCLGLLVLAPAIVHALPASQREIFEKGVYYYDYNQGLACNALGVEPDINAGTNTDYAGNQILTDAQWSTIQANQPIYQQAAEAADIPWQMIAVIHLRETNLGRNNPGNGQGIYQFVSGNGGPYPTGPVSEEEFLRQTKLAAEFIKSKAAGNVAANKNLSQSASPDAVKDTFFGYNGRSSKYADQAASLGFNRETQPYEGSPYVMNKADEKRDPAVNKTTWGQVKRDFGPIEYPANNDYGAFVAYGALAGVSSNGNCSNAINGTVREKVVAIAKQELSLWESGQLTPGTSFHKYSQGRNENWCADFVSWVYNQAGYPLKDTKEGNVPGVITIKEIGEAGGKFNFHPVGSGYVPKPGDIVVQKTNASHVNIVVAVEGDIITVIGGNQGGSGDMNGYYARSKVTTYKMSITHEKNTGFVSPD